MTLLELLQSQSDHNPVPYVALRPNVEEKKAGTYVGTTTYSALCLSAPKFRTLITHLAEHAVNLAKSLGADAIAVRGTSGYSVAFAMRMLTNFPIIVARKAGESSHGCSISLVDNGCGRTVNSYVILDDVVASGATVRQMVQDLKPAACVGVLEYYGLMNAIDDGYTGTILPAYRSRTVHDIGTVYGYAFEPSDFGKD